MLIYFAGPLFSQAERQFNQQLTHRLEQAGFQVFLPQRDGVETRKIGHGSISREEWARAVFQIDSGKILEADIFLVILDGRVPDEGACVELGIAYCHRQLQRPDKFLIGLHTDIRAAIPGSELNPMVRVPLDHVVFDEDALLDILKNHQQHKSNG